MSVYPAIVAVFLVPAVHPLLEPLVGESSRLLWWIHVLPVAILSHRHGFWGMVPAVLWSGALVLLGERLFGAGYWDPVSWESAAGLSAGVLFADSLVGAYTVWTGRSARRLRERAYTDDLTGLPNRRLFLTRLRHRLEQAKRKPLVPFAVLFMDLDDFKLINDSLGHAVGNDLLRRLARRLERCVRSPDTVARWAGDEFVVLLDEISEVQDATRVARRILEAMELPFEAKGHRVLLGSSLGIALGSSSYSDPETLVADADTAMYRAKKEAQGRVAIFDEAMHEQAMERLALENDLRQALERGEFLHYFQPIVSVETGGLVGFEALVRWRHPKRGFLTPAQFIPLAEDTGFIVPLGDFVLEEACRTLARWSRMYPELEKLSVSVNLSAKQFAQSDLVENVRKVCREADVSPALLQLEITETALMHRAEMAARYLSALRSMGIEVALDDFGTGYSSLGYLHRFPVHSLKIDRSFVNAVAADERNAAIIRAIVALAQHLGLRTVAEGVETEEQLSIVRSLGCDFAQGFHYSQPLPSAEAEALLGRLHEKLAAER